MKRLWIILILFGFALVTVMFFVNGASAAHTIDFYSKLAFGQPYTEIFCEGDFTGIDLLARIDENDTGGVVTVTNTQYDFDNTHLHFSDTTNAEIVQKQIQFSGDTFIGYKLYHLLLFTNNTNVFFNDTTFHCSGEFRLNKYYAYGEDGCTVYIDRCKFTDEELTAGNRLFLGLNSATQIKYYVSNSTFIHVSFQYDNITMENSFLFGKARVGTAIANGVAYLDNVYIADWQQGIAYTDVKSANKVTVSNNLYGFGVVAGANRLFENCNAVGNSYLVFILAVSGDYHFTNTYSDTWEVFGAYALVTLHRNYTVDVMVKDEYDVISGADVTITNATGTVMYTDTTGADGKIATCDLNVSYRNIAGWEHNNPFTINVSYGGNRFIEFEQEIWDETNWTLYLPPYEAPIAYLQSSYFLHPDLLIINPNPANNQTDFTNYIQGNTTGTYTSVDVHYNNFSELSEGEHLGYEDDTTGTVKIDFGDTWTTESAAQIFTVGTNGTDANLITISLELPLCRDATSDGNLEEGDYDVYINITTVNESGFPQSDVLYSYKINITSLPYDEPGYREWTNFTGFVVQLEQGENYSINVTHVRKDDGGDESGQDGTLLWFWIPTWDYAGGGFLLLNSEGVGSGGGWDDYEPYDLMFRWWVVEGDWNQIVNLSFYNGSDSVFYGRDWAYKNGTIFVFNENYTNPLTTYLWNVTANHPVSGVVNLSFEFETGVDTSLLTIPVMVTRENLAIGVSMGSLLGVAMVFVVRRRRREERL